MNFLEQLTFEWLVYRGLFVRNNIKCDKRINGGYDGEMDVLGFNPISNTLDHYETSMDADSNQQRIKRFNNKFRYELDYYNQLLGTNATTVSKFAIVGTSNKLIDFGNNIVHKPVPIFIREIVNQLKDKDPMKEAVPESLPILRGIQFSNYYSRR